MKMKLIGFIAFGIMAAGPAHATQYCAVGPTLAKAVAILYAEIEDAEFHRDGVNVLDG
jgi:hypothetical protein